MPNRWVQIEGTRSALGSGSGHQSNLLVHRELNPEKLLKELERERNLKEELRQRLEKADADLRAWQSWHESDKIERKQELEDATTKIDIKLQEAEKTIEHFSFKFFELEKTNQELKDIKEDEIRKSSALASALEQEHDMFDRIMNVWKQRVTSLQADLDNLNKEYGLAQAQLLRKHMAQQRPHHTATSSNNTLDTAVTSDTENYNPRDTSDVPSPKKKLAKTSEKFHGISEPKTREVDEAVPTQRKGKSADGRYNTQTNRLIHPKHNQRVIKRKTTLNRKVLVNSNRRQAKCKLCNKLFASKVTLNVHMRRIHLRESNFSCDFCDKTFLWKHQLALHRTKHTKEPLYSCESCPEKFRTNYQLKLHNMTHLKERPYACELRPKRSKLSRTLSGHMKLLAKERRYACGVCPRKFSTLQCLNKHKGLHTGEEPFQCKICSRKYRDVRSLMRHEQNIHPDSLPYQCKICAFGFKLRRNLQKHRKTCSAGERPYKCSVCPRKFKSSHFLEMHEKAHATGEPPHECKECGRRFYEKHYLTMHQRSHLN